MRHLRAAVSAAFCGLILASAACRPDTVVYSGGWEVAPTDFEMGLLPRGEHDVALRVKNSSGVARRIIGLTEGCQPNCCWCSAHRRQVVVGPGQVVEYHITLLAHHDGEFEIVVGLFLEEGAIRTVPITIRGESKGGWNGP